MILKRITLENIRSYEQLDLNFTEGSILFSGDVGSGKTTILLAIEFALFGLQPGQKGTSLLRNGRDFGKIVLEFTIDGKEIIIERELKRAKTVSQGRVSITIDNARQEMSIRELKNQILRLLNYPSEFEKKTNLLYKFTVYTPQEEMKQIITESPDIRTDTLRHVFGMDKYKKIEQNTEIIIKKLKEEIKEKQGFVLDLNDKKISLKQNKTNIEKIKFELEKIQEEIRNIKLQKQQKEKQLEEIEKKIEEKNMVDKEIEKTKLLFSSKRDSLLRLEKEIFQLEKEKVEFNEQDIETTKAQEEQLNKTIKQNQEKYNEILGKINFLDNKKYESLELRDRMSNMKKCPTCLQDVSPEYRINISNKIANELREIEENLKNQEKNKIVTSQEIDKINSELNESRKKLQELIILKIKAEDYKKNLQLKHEKEKEKNRLNEDIKILEEQIDRLNKTSVNLHEVEEQHKQQEKNLNIIREQEKNFEIKRAELAREQQIITVQLEELQREINKKEQEKNKLDKMNELRDWLSEKFLNLILFIEKNVMLRLRQEFSKIFNNWFSMLISDEIEVSLDENFTPLIQQRGYFLDYDFLSGGERTAIALAYRLALNQVINSLLSKIKTRDIVILDEPTDGFSEQQIDKMRDIFNELDVKQLILVSHETKIESFVDHIIKIKKEQNLSRIE